MMEENTKATLPVLRAADLEAQAANEHWLIEGLWAREAIGLIGGAPKLGKSWLGLDMAVSVASGLPALGHFPVAEPGRALVYLAEDSLPQVRSRIEGLCMHRGLDIASLDLHVITAPTLRIDTVVDQELLAATLESLRPRLLILDPLVRLDQLDENSSAEISKLLGFIRGLQRRFETAIVLVHHASKRARAQPGQSLRGSSDLHAIGDSNAYLTRTGERLMLTLEHRAASPPDPMEIELIVDEASGSSQLRVCDRAAAFASRDVMARGMKPTRSSAKRSHSRHATEYPARLSGPSPSSPKRAQAGPPKQLHVST
ncbi:hypothetical protein Poly30_48800 [Planctomycetes bacterium Poly30]|uniref:AAA family ATPase n=1 Tax=Saltatorellus ferox TaxID=2528018 RepID=A0A518EZ06_9BACT|nr:hypothetical protein Poly30_48800 [Planctomycetes bacterium Poly30]